MMRRQALIFGATGAVGRELLKLCLEGDRYSRVSVIARKPTSLEHEKLQWIEAKFDALEDLEPVVGLEGGDAYCCLGTTIKSAGSEAAFRKVDFDFVLNSARFAKKCGAQQFSMVSALGANPESGTFYNRTKGEVEAAVAAENFPSLRIFRPSLLKGERDEFRLGEEIGNWVSLLLTPLFHLGLRKYQPVEISKLARAMYVSADEDRTDGKHYVFECDEIQLY
jgi:uncharacterized protein YbjT (DUF2867 family)